MRRNVRKDNPKRGVRKARNKTIAGGVKMIRNKKQTKIRGVSLIRNQGVKIKRNGGVRLIRNLHSLSLTYRISKYIHMSVLECILSANFILESVTLSIMCRFLCMLIKPA
jgi:hypothetical protein